MKKKRIIRIIATFVVVIGFFLTFGTKDALPQNQGLADGYALIFHNEPNCCAC